MNGAADVSAEMNRALDFMRANGGMLHRHPGGFWWRKQADFGFSSFGTPTLQALERRGLVRFTDWKRGRSGEFPITAELISGTAA